MPTDTNQTIRDSRKAAMSFLNAAKAKDRERKGRTSTFSRGGGVRGSGKEGAVESFLSAGARSAARTAAAQRGEETDFDLAQRIRQMSDDDFNAAISNGTLTPEQIRRAGEYDWDIYMGDVWSETDLPDQMPEPTYDEFIADPEKYGYQRGINEEYDQAFDRYRRGAQKQQQ